MTDPDKRSRAAEQGEHPEKRPVRDEELDAVNGGGRRTGEIVFVHTYDKASPVLM